MSEEKKQKKLTKEQKKDLKLKEKFKEIDKKFKRVDKLYKLSTEFEGFRNEEFNQLKENLCSQIDQHVDDKISQYSHEIMTDIRDHQLGTLPIVSSKEAIRMLKKEVDDLKEIQNGETDRILSNIGLVESLVIKQDKYQNQRLTKQAETHRAKIEQVKGELGKIYSEIKKTKIKDELLKFLIFFIALNFGLTIFLLINFLLVFDF